MLNQENPDKVAYPNVISLNKAKLLYKEGKPFEPNIYEFLEALFIYGEMQFEYNGIYYGVERINHDGKANVIEMYKMGTTSSEYFDTKEDYINNAKIGSEYIKDIWDKTTDRYWLQ